MNDTNNILVEKLSFGQNTNIVPPHLGYLDGLRALAALYVLIHHTLLQAKKDLALPYVMELIKYIFLEGRYAVDLFIVISGFSLMLPIIRDNGILRNGAGAFFKRRARRILPAYYISMAVSLLLIFTVIGKKTGTHWDNSIPVNFRDVVTHLLLIQELFHSTIYKINHVFWSVSVEVHIYLLFPILVLSWNRWGALPTTLVGIFISLALWHVIARTPLNLLGISPHYLTLFTFGMLAAQVSFSKVSMWNVAVLAVIILFISFLHPHSNIKSDLIVGGISGCLIGLVASGKLTMLERYLSWKPLTFIGGFAYSIYLIHAPLLQIISQYIIMPLNLPALPTILFFLFMGIPLILIISYGFYLVAERPLFFKRA